MLEYEMDYKIFGSDSRNKEPDLRVKGKGERGKEFDWKEEKVAICSKMAHHCHS
jgi:hypothetical protein